MCSSQVYDIYIVPISVSFDRLLEAHLYADELRGTPKPKESTGKLVAAAHVLRQDYGDVWVTVAEPISVREYFKKFVHRLQVEIGVF
jgi:glycerone phosphate O-acyltransferase